MATPLPIDFQEGTIRFRKSGSLLENRLGIDIEIDASSDREVLKALKENGRLPLNRDRVRLGALKVGLTSAEESLRFEGGRGAITFKGGAAFQKGLGIYSNAALMLADLGLDNHDLASIDFTARDVERWFVLQWGYDLEGAATGSVALGPSLSAGFGVDAARGGAFAVIRGFKNNPQAATAVRSLIDSWRLPRQIQSPKDFMPGTWILSEVDGSIRGSIGVEFGFSQNWVRSVEAAGLAGDIGLKIQAAAKAAFGFEASGRYAVMVGRESLDPNDETIRVRVHKLAKKGWSFALDANLGVTPSTGEFLPKEQLEDFIAGIFGVHGAQIAETLKEVRYWTDPTKPLSTLAGEFLVDFARERLAAGTGVDLERGYGEAHQRILGFLDQWDELGSRAASALWAAVRLDRTRYTEFTERVRKLSASGSLQDELTSLFARPDLLSTPAGKWLQSVLPEQALSVLRDPAALKRIESAAQTTLAILEGRVLDHLLDYVENKIGLPAIRKAIAENDFEKLDENVKQKLAEFLGRPLDHEGLESIRKTIGTLEARGQELYRAGVRALNRTYEFSFHYAYQKSTTRDALLDVSLDFASNPTLGKALAAALDGDFTTLLGDRVPGVSFHEGVLTHRLERQSHVEISFPFYTSAMDRKNWADAQFRIEEDDGRLFLYSLKAEDQLTKRDRWASRLSVTLDVAHGGPSGVRRHDGARRGTIDYHFLQAIRDMRTVQLQRQLSPLADVYFRDQFAGATGTDKPSVAEWVSDLDKLFDRIPGEGNGTGALGNTLLSLRVSVPGEVLVSWLDAPEDPKDIIYMEMSRRVQAAMRRFIPYIYFQDVRQYANLVPAAVVLAYASLPISTAIAVDKVLGRVLALNTNKDVYWDWVDDSDVGERKAMLRHPATIEKLRATMGRVQEILASTPSLRGRASDYTPDRIQTARVLTTVDDVGKKHFESLLYCEARLIASAVSAGTHIGRFGAQSRTPERALEPLAEFGADITETFNTRLRTLFEAGDNSQLLRNLGVLALAEVSQAFPNAPRVRPTAALDLSIFRKDAIFPPRGYPENPVIEREALGIHQSIIETGESG
jgi:hypothetical protein